MLIEVEVTAGANSPLDLHRMFDLLDAPRPVARVMAPGPDGADLWCDVTGWEHDAPCPAMAATAEDSGEGVILLIYGGGDGIRLRPAAAPTPWRLSDPSQWGEPCLMLAPNAPYGNATIDAPGNLPEGAEMTTINTQEDFLRALAENPQWREAVRALILGEEMMRLPAKFDTFVETEFYPFVKRVDHFIGEQLQFNKRVDHFIGEQIQFNARVDQFIGRATPVQRKGRPLHRRATPNQRRTARVQRRAAPVQRPNRLQHQAVDRRRGTLERLGYQRQGCVTKLTVIAHELGTALRPHRPGIAEMLDLAFGSPPKARLSAANSGASTRPTW